MAVSKKLKRLYFQIFEGPELLTANMISNFQERRDLNKNLDKTRKLTKEQKAAIREFWKPYKKISSKWAQFYCTANGKFDPRYIPNDLFFTKIDQHFNNRKLGYGFNDKNYYTKIFDGIKQPQTVVRKINRLIFDADYNQISAEEAKAKILAFPEVICKPSQETGSGRGILFFRREDEKEIDEFLSDPSFDDYIVQKIVCQHPELDRVHKGSVNCIRICSLLMEDGVHILSSILRMGFGDSRVDNASAKDNEKYDGWSCGIDENGCLKKYAYGYTAGHRHEQHPDGLVFEGFQIPSYDKAVELVLQAHPRIGHFRLVSWDISIDETGDAVLVEANMRKGGIKTHQFNNGPLFGELTQRVLNEVYGKDKKG